MQVVDEKGENEDGVLAGLWARPGRGPCHSAHMLLHREAGKCSCWVPRRKQNVFWGTQSSL